MAGEWPRKNEKKENSVRPNKSPAVTQTPPQAHTGRGRLSRTAVSEIEWHTPISNRPDRRVLYKYLQAVRGLEEGERGGWQPCWSNCPTPDPWRKKERREMNAAGKEPESIMNLLMFGFFFFLQSERQLCLVSWVSWNGQTADAGFSGLGHKCTCEVHPTSAVQPDGQLQVRRAEEDEGEEEGLESATWSLMPKCLHSNSLQGSGTSDKDVSCFFFIISKLYHGLTHSSIRNKRHQTL